MKHIASDDVLYRTDKTVIATKHLISLVKDKKLREYLSGCIGLPVDKIAEYVGAYLMSHQLVDGHGYDLKNGDSKMEVKWSFFNRSICGKGYEQQTAYIGNLNSKACDLLVFVCDDYLPTTHKDYIRVFQYPVKVWKSYWKKNKASLSFGSNQYKWYKDASYRVL